QIAPSFEPADPSPPPEQNADDRLIDGAVTQALHALDPDERALVLTYFGPGPEAGNFRAVARELHWPRDRVRQRLFLAVAHLSGRLRDSGALSETNARLCGLSLRLGYGADELSHEVGVPREDVEEKLKSVLREIGRSLARVALQLRKPSLGC